MVPHIIASESRGRILAFYEIYCRISVGRSQHDSQRFDRPMSIDIGVIYRHVRVFTGLRLLSFTQNRADTDEYYREMYSVFLLLTFVY